MKKILLLITALLVAPMVVLAQNAPPTPAPVSVLTGGIPISVGSSSAATALPSTAVGATAITLYNSGDADLSFALGGSTVTASLTGACAGSAGPNCDLPAHTRITIYRGTATYIATISASSTSLVVFQGNGPLEFGSVGGSGGGGSSPCSSFGTSAGTCAQGNDSRFISTSGTSLLAGNGSGAFANVTIGSGLSFSGGTLSSTGGGAVSSVFGRTGAVVAASNDYTFAQLASPPTTLGGYGITDAISHSVPSADIIVGNGSGIAANVAVSGDCTIANTGALTCTKSSGTLFGTAAFASTSAFDAAGAAATAQTNAETFASNAANITSGTLPNARLVSIPNSAFANSAMTIGGQSISLGGTTTNQGNGAKLQLSTGTTTTNDCVKFDANGNAVDNGSACGSGGSGTVNSGTSGQVAYYGSTGTAVSGEALSALIDSAIGNTQGDVLYRSGTAWSVLAPSTSGLCLQTGGSGANPSWASCGSGSGVTWPASADLVISNATNTPAGLAPVNGDCVIAAAGAWTAAPCGTAAKVSAVSVTPAAADWAAWTYYTITATSKSVTIPVSTTLSTNGGLVVGGNGFAVTVTSTSPDTINGGSAGGSVTVNAGCAAFITTDGAGHLYAQGLTCGTGTVTSIATNNGLTGGTITSSGTIGLAAIAADNALVNSTGSSGVPVATALTSCSSGSSALTYNTSTHAFGCNSITGGVTFPATGDIVISNSTSSPAGLAVVNGDCVIGSAGSWIAGSCSTGSGTVTSVASGTGLTGGPITGSGTLSLAAITADSVLMNATGSSAAPSGVALPTGGTNGCAGTANAVTYNTTTHAFGCNTISGGGGGGLPASGYISGQWYPQFSGGSAANGLVTANRLYYVPFIPQATQTFTQIAIYVTTLFSGGNCEIGVFNAGTGKPSSLLVDAGHVSTTTTGQKTISSLSISVTAGTLYYEVVGCDNSTAGLAGMSGSPGGGNPLQDWYLGTNAPGFGSDQNWGAWTYSAGALPGTFPSVTHNTGAFQPFVWMAL